MGEGRSCASRLGGIRTLTYTVADAFTRVGPALAPEVAHGSCSHGPSVSSEIKTEQPCGSNPRLTSHVSCVILETYWGRCHCYISASRWKTSRGECRTYAVGDRHFVFCRA